MAAAEAPDLVSQLASLRLQREEPPPSRSWIWIAGALVAVLLALGAYLSRDRFLKPTVPVTAVVLLQPGQEPPLFVPYHHLRARRAARI